ncbi:hypothetical protein BDN70DRAFT_716430 [Pholiota conissans]|uniref:Nephrocystin 3-like N-terminal domain-containing protein n=1 Tax=Pholiota conissans TaxID=109636 RepID=A0A9P5Z084_9AGAR|nr:hypothetical protein BDN70DRAFT_716430 [Pholiota conissans]
MASTEKHSPVPIQACLRAIEITDTGNLRIKKVYFVVVSLDDCVVAESERKSNENSSLHWPEKHIFEVHPSSTVIIKLYRESRFPGVKHLVGEHIGKVVDLLENGGTSMDLKDEYGVVIVPKLELDILATIGTVLQITKSIMDVVSKANPILQASWTVLSTVYNAIQEVELQDDSVRELAESLRELLGIAKENSRLLVIEDTTNVIDDIGRMSLKVTSLIYEYTRPNFSWRALKSQLSKDLKDRIGKCQKACVELREKLQIRLILETSKMTKEIKNHSANIQIMLDIIKDDKLAEEIWKWLSAPDSSGNYNAALGKRQAGTCDWFLNGKWFDDIEQEAGLLWIKGTAGCGKTILW